jgi:hypothetical protein
MDPKVLNIRDGNQFKSSVFYFNASRDMYFDNFHTKVELGMLTFENAP